VTAGGSEVETLVDDGGELARLAGAAAATVPSSLVAKLDAEGELTLDRPSAIRFLFETEHLLGQRPELATPFVRRLVDLLHSVRTTPGTTLTFKGD
jgi:hypothetical protein